jgi:hypothetical protein
MSSCIPSAKKAFSLSSLRFSNGNTAIDLSSLRATARGRRKKPAAAEMITPVATSIMTLRRRCAPGTAIVGVVFIPSGVTSKAQARMRAIGNPLSNSTMTRRCDQFGSSHAGKTADAI